MNLGQLRVDKSHPGRLVGTAEIPQLPAGFAAVPYASPLCMNGRELRIAHIADEKSAREYWVATDTTCDCTKLACQRVAVVVGQDLSLAFRRYQPSDYDQVAALWSRINRELAPAGMEELFEQYIATMITGEL